MPDRMRARSQGDLRKRPDLVFALVLGALIALASIARALGLLPVG